MSPLLLVPLLAAMLCGPALAQSQVSPTQSGAQPSGPGAPMQSPVAPATASPFNSTSSSSSTGSPVVTAPGLARPGTDVPGGATPAQPLGPAGAEAPASPLFEAAPTVRRALRRDDETQRDRRDRREFQGGNAGSVR